MYGDAPGVHQQTLYTLHAHGGSEADMMTEKAPPNYTRAKIFEQLHNTITDMEHEQVRMPYPLARKLAEINEWLEAPWTEA